MSSTGNVEHACQVRMVDAQVTGVPVLLKTLLTIDEVGESSGESEEAETEEN